MKLRHKKPLNSYKADRDDQSSEILEDDFRHQTYSIKKNLDVNSQHVGKLARILVSFVKNINDDYRNRKKQRSQENNQKKITNHNQFKIPKKTLEELQLDLKQYQKKQPNINQKQIQKQPVSQKKTIIIPQCPPKKVQPPQPEPPLNKEYPNKDIVNMINMMNMPFMPPMNPGISIPSNIGVQQANGSNSNIGNMNNYLRCGPGNINGLNFSNINPNFLYMNMLSNPSFQQFLSSLNMNLPSMNLNNTNNINNSQNWMNMFKMGMNIDLYTLQNMLMGSFNMMKNSTMNYPNMNYRPNQPPQNMGYNSMPNHQIEQYSTRPMERPFKRAKYHISIAYYIYLEKMKKQGKTTTPQQNLLKVDPTLPARELKERKKSDCIHIGNEVHLK